MLENSRKQDYLYKVELGFRHFLKIRDLGQMKEKC